MKSLRTATFAAIVLLAILLGSSAGYSQTRLSQYITTQFSGGYTGTIAGAPGSVQLAGYAGVYYFGTPYTISMPFSFTLDGTNFLPGSTLYIYSGSASFTSFQPYYYPVLSPNSPTNFGYTASQWPSTFAPLSGLQINGGVYYQVTGAAPNRVLIVEWYQCGSYPSRSSGYVSYQMKLYEGSNTIEYVYDTHGLSLLYSTSYNLNVGINGSTSPSFQQLLAVGTSNTSSPSVDYRFSTPLPIELSAFPKSLTYGGVVAGSSVTLCVNVKHVGTGGTLQFNSASITGSGDFSIVSSPPGPLTPGQSSQYCVKFSPTGSGARSAVLTISTNGQDSGLQTIALNGTGFSPQLSVDSIIRFKKTRTRMGDSLTQWVHLGSFGQAPVSFSAFGISGIDADQYYVSHFPQNPLPIGANDSIGITYVPTREGLRSALLTVVNNSSNNPAVLVTLKGTGILPHIVLTPTSLQFDSTAEGDTVCKTVDIWNAGTDTLRLKQNFLSSNDGDFHYTGLFGSDTAIAPDHHKTVGICFIPVQRGTRQGRILFQTNIIPTYETPRRDTASILTIDLTGNGLPLGVFGNAISGLPVLDSTLVGTSVCRTDSLKNTGDADIMVTSGNIVGQNPSNFTMSGISFPFLLKARTTKTFTICGQPDLPGLRLGAITFTGTTGGRTIGLNVQLGVFGFKACVSAVPPTLFTGVTLPNNGSDSVQCVKIINCGDISAVYHVALSGVAKGDYSVSPAVSPSIAAKDTATFCVTYKPSAVGQSIASLDVTTADQSVNVSVPLAGADGCAVLTHGVASIPNTMAFLKGQFTISVTNGGTYPWSPGTANISDPAHFKFISCVPDPIPAGQTGTITMEFDPNDVKNYTGTVSFPNGGPCEDAVVSIDLSASGITSSVKETSNDGFSLDQNYPNPTIGKTSFTYTTPNDAEVRITLNDMTGKLVRTIISGRVSAGEHSVSLDASTLPSGTYVYLFESGSVRLVRQLILTK